MSREPRKLTPSEAAALDSRLTRFGKAIENLADLTDAELDAAIEILGDEMREDVENHLAEIADKRARRKSA
jgi:hypothetical protein